MQMYVVYWAPVSVTHSCPTTAVTQFLWRSQCHVSSLPCVLSPPGSCRHLDRQLAQCKSFQLEPCTKFWVPFIVPANTGAILPLFSYWIIQQMTVQHCRWIDLRGGTDGLWFAFFSSAGIELEQFIFHGQLMPQLRNLHKERPCRSVSWFSTTHF